MNRFHHRPARLLAGVLLLGSLLASCSRPAGIPAQSSPLPASPSALPSGSSGQPTLTQPPVTAAPTPAPTPTTAADYRPLSLSAADCSYGGELRAIETLDAYTVRFTLCRPEVAFL
ncbi:MAG: hypothetical protein ACKOC5_09760, partial [Chloroflexota bacterium]